MRCATGRITWIALALVISVQFFLRNNHAEVMGSTAQIKSEPSTNSRDLVTDSSTDQGSEQADEDSRKAECELNYWNEKKKQEGSLSNDHYKIIYTTHANLTEEFYVGKKVLDIGCGPRGSLEWAVGSTAVCVDPLAKEYGKLGANSHKMVYVHTGAEDLPFPDESFDIVTSINNLDHVSNVNTALSEISRVLKDEGTFLLYVDLRPYPTACEPRSFDFTLVQTIESLGFTIAFRRDTEHGNKYCKSTILEASWTCPAYDHDGDKTKRRAFLVLSATRRRQRKAGTIS
jgi:SAM-dependent methyltransferase